MRRHRLFSLGLASLLLALGTAQAQAPLPSTFILDNGLQVVVQHDPRAPVVTAQLVVRVGSSHEPPGQSGLSHALEHLLFRGSEKTEPGEFSRIVERLGGRDNAYTTPDYTVYHLTLPSERLEVALELGADLLSGARLADEEFVREIEAVLAERRESIDDFPTERLHELWLAQAFPASGYRTPVIGWPQDIERLSPNALRNWYRSWYAPNNASLVVVGDVQGEQVKKLAERHFGRLPARQLPTSMPPLELQNPGARTVHIEDLHSTPYLLMGFNVPSRATAQAPQDVAALRLTAALLASGRSARLPLRLEREQPLLQQIDVRYAAIARGDALFSLSAHINASQPAPLATLEHALRAQLQQLKDTPPTVAEVERARNRLLADEVFARDALEGQAGDLAEYLGSALPLAWRADAETELHAVTAQQVQHVAQTYFTRERLTTAYLTTPEPPHE
ncbi:M16 family metallopeptidase [Pseudomonas fontis]|uniref:Insulinase family protein n=1 Tax=Pseudomonas fontis TaxID=2942633 RepID=A0ABT5NRY0_9PSED|nr:pitrilysin family protein [Pseudomonas fontis]MDD0973614.1 insulinase family protein [Pseudomonas fontis]MDD0990911.1 insulinase family protein [Pseudomonas fontis]